MNTAMQAGDLGEYMRIRDLVKLVLPKGSDPKLTAVSIYTRN